MLVWDQGVGSTVEMTEFLLPLLPGLNLRQIVKLRLQINVMLPATYGLPAQRAGRHLALVECDLDVLVLLVPVSLAAWCATFRHRELEFVGLGVSSGVDVFDLAAFAQ